MLQNKYTINESPQLLVLKVKESQKNYSKRNRQNIDNKKMNLLKKISLHRLMDLKVDYAFKQLFGNEKNKELTVVFLNAILQKTGRSRIKDISFKNTDSGGEYIDDKQSRLDLLVVTETEEWINVEIQFTNKYDMIKRSIYYWAGVYRGPFKEKMAYKQLRPVIAINIVNFTLFNGTKRFHNTFHLYEDEEMFKLTNIMEFHFLEMTKLVKYWKEGKLDPWNDVLARWLLMLGMVDHRQHKVYEDIYRELEVIAMKDETLRSAFNNWEKLSMTQEQYFAYESRLKRVLDEEATQAEFEFKQKEIERLTQEMENKKQEVENATLEMESKKQEVENATLEMENMKREVEHEKKLVESRRRELEQMMQEVDQQIRKLNLMKQSDTNKTS